MVRTAVLLSGGVDSSVALMRLVEAGRHELTAYYIKIWLEDELAFLGRCPWEEDLDFARAVCRSTGVQLEIVPLQRQYLDTVVAYTVAELEAGRTPSPDVLCNRHIKFGAFVEAVEEGFDAVASGHYARLRHDEGLAHLLCGVDPAKDQSYFLSQLDQRQLSRCLFPIGELSKAEVRRAARRLGLPNHDRPDSQGICFLGRIPYDEFIAHHLGERRGEIRESGTDRLLGEHRGYWFYTIGQRRGLGLAGGPWYVVAKNIEQNLVQVVHARDLEGHRRGSLRIDSPHWVARPPTSSRLKLRLRHGGQMVGCSLRDLPQGALELELDEPDPGIARGQFAVLYDGDECLGGGPIG
jgi:tRNA-specific 2-thiouridylase